MSLNYKNIGYMNAFAYVLMIVINALANIIPINGVTTGEVSDSYANVFTPAPITFSIWGIIYIFLGGFILYQLGLIKGSRPKRVLDNIGILFVLSCAFNSLWILAWHYEMIFGSLMLMLLLLGSLIGMYLKLNSYGFIEKTIERYFVMVPFSLYLGWISIATIANTIVFIVSTGFKVSRTVGNIWLVIALVIGGILAVHMLRKQKDVVYALVIIWAYVGIIIRWTTIETSPNYVAIIVPSVIIGMILSNIKIFPTLGS